jgi:hypothetical protein
MMSSCGPRKKVGWRWPKKSGLIKIKEPRPRQTPSRNIKIMKNLRKFPLSFIALS